MPSPPGISVVIPVWNEEGYLERTVRHALGALDALGGDFEVLLVDDGSTDRTPEICSDLARRDPRVRILTHTANLGLGRTLRTGLGASTKDVVVYVDADLPFDFAEIGRAVSLLDLLDADMICGYRHDRTAEGPKRSLYSFTYNWLVRGAFGVHIKDVNFGFKVIRRRVLEAIDLRSEGSFIDAELVVKSIRRGFRVHQIGVDYFPRTRGVSTLASPSTIAGILSDFVRLFPETRSPREPEKPVRTAPPVRAVGGEDRKKAAK